MTTKKPPPEASAAAKSPKKPAPKPLRQRDNRLRKKPSQDAAEVFADAIATTPNEKGAITKAAQKAYPKQSKRAACVTGSRLLRHPRVQELIQKRRQRALEAADITRQEVVGLLAQQATSSLGDVLNSNGELDLDLARERGLDHLIKEVTVTERHHTKRVKVGKNRYATKVSRRITTKYKIHDPQKAMDLLAEIAGWKKQPMRNPVDSAKESYEIMRRKPEYGDVPDPELARLAQEAHGLPPSTIPDILAGTVKQG